MKLIISPAKRLRTDGDFLPAQRQPALLEQALPLWELLSALSPAELGRLLRCNDALAASAYRFYRDFDPREGSLPALLAFDGIQYKYMAPQVFDRAAFDYVERHLRIVSGLYGLLRPFDAIVPHRLEMQTPLRPPGCRDLYDYWGADLAAALTADGDDTVLDLASQEYSRAVVRHLGPGVACVSCVFGELVGGRVIEKGVHVKMARGQMVRFLAEQNAQSPQSAKAFDRLGFRFDNSRSTARVYVFLRKNRPGVDERGTP